MDRRFAVMSVSKDRSCNSCRIQVRHGWETGCIIGPYNNSLPAAFESFQGKNGRFSNFNRNAKRFRTQAQQRKIINSIKEGSVDILIGTHRLLSNDVNYKDLGLLIIDEEQRFGVQHKETIKRLRSSIDI